jgi:RNA polymerase sigma-B factor
MAATGRPPIATDASIDELLARYRESHDRAVRDELVAATAWMATQLACRFRDRGEPFDDLVQVARIGLLHAIDRYEPSYGVPFGAYATPTILGELRRHFRDCTWKVHVPRDVKELRSTLKQLGESFSEPIPDAARLGALASLLRITDDEVAAVRAADSAYRVRLLDEGQVGGATEVATAAAFDEIVDRDLVCRLLHGLGPRPRTILYLRYFEGLSQQQIASHIGTSQMHVSRILASSLKELRLQAV